MTIDLTGTASDELPEVLATGATDVRTIFVSMAARAAGASVPVFAAPFYTVAPFEWRRYVP